MRKVLATAGFLGVTLGAAWGAAYDDFVKAGELRRVGNADGALAAYTAALSAGDLAPAYAPDAYISRAQIYMARGQCAVALADVDAALKLRPALLDGLRLRATVQDCLGKADAALADLGALIAAAPVAQNYALRGQYHWFHNSFDRAAEDFATSLSLHNPRNFDWQPVGYSLGWYAIAAKRAGSFAPADFAEKAKKFDLDPWPGAVVSFFLGKITEDKLYKEAGEGEKDAPKFHKCDADFFLGEWRVGSGDAAGGKALLETVVKECPKSFDARAAKSDLRRIP